MRISLRTVGCFFVGVGLGLLAVGFVLVEVAITRPAARPAAVEPAPAAKPAVQLAGLELAV